MKKTLYTIFSLFFITFIFYFGVGFYIANSILHIDPECGQHKGSLPNTWDTKLDHHEYAILEKRELRKNFPSSMYHINEWEDIYFDSREGGIKLNGWLFNFFPERPIVIVVHGLFPNGKCKPESNLVASLLIKHSINAFTIDLRNYGRSDTVSKYENLGLREYKDVLGAFDFLKTIGFNDDQIGLAGISLGGSNVIFSAANETKIKAIWSDSSLAEFKLILRDEIARYGMPNIFGPAVSFFGKILTGINPNNLSPAKYLSKNQAYFFTHGAKDKRVLFHHFEYFQNFANANNINADFWMVPDAFHIDAMFKYPEEYSYKMKKFFEDNLK